MGSRSSRTRRSGTSRRSERRWFDRLGSAPLPSALHMSDIVKYEVHGPRRADHAQPTRGPQRRQRRRRQRTWRRRSIRSRPTTQVWVGMLAANTEGQERPVFSRRRRPEGDQRRAGGIARRPERGGFAGFVYRERQQAGHRRRRRAGDRRRVRDRARSRPRRRDHPIVVRPGRGEAQPDRRRRRAVPSATRDRPGGGDGSDPHRRADPGPARPTSSGSSTRLVEPGQAVEEAITARRADLSPTPRSRCWASRKVVLAAAYEDDETLEEDDQRRVRRWSWRRRTPRKG